MDNEKKREKSRRDLSRLEKDLQDSNKQLQAKAMPSKLFVSLLVMLIMFGVNRRYGNNSGYCLPGRSGFRGLFQVWQLVMHLKHLESNLIDAAVTSAVLGEGVSTVGIQT